MSNDNDEFLLAEDLLEDALDDIQIDIDDEISKIPVGQDSVDAQTFISEGAAEGFKLQLSEDGETTGHRRQSDREFFPAKSMIKLIKNGRVYKGKARDIHTSGAGIVFYDSAPEKGEEVMIEFFPTEKSDGFSVHAQIVHRSEDTLQKGQISVGLKFLGTPKFAQTCIERYISRQAAA